MNKSKKIIIAIAVAVLLLSLVISKSFLRVKNEQINASEAKIITPSITDKKPLYNNVFSLTINAGNVTVHAEFNKGDTLKDVLDKSVKSAIIYVNGKDYPDLGFFVTDIGSLHSGGGKNLIYYINGKESSVGVSSYVPQNGDIIDWKLE